MHEVLVNRLGGLSLPRKSVVWLTDRPVVTLDVSVDVKQYNNNRSQEENRFSTNSDTCLGPWFVIELAQAIGNN